jgi:NADH-quinone oxidoreductase subunit J
VSKLAFLALALPIVVAALTVVVHRNPVHSACALVMTLFLLAVAFVGLDAQLVAALQVIVYAGAVVVLFLFVIMLLNLPMEDRATGGPGLVFLATAGGIALAVLVVTALRHAAPAPAASLPARFGETEQVAARLFTAYLLPFELTSILLLVAIVGAVALARKPSVREDVG